MPTTRKAASAKAETRKAPATTTKTVTKKAAAPAAQRSATTTTAKPKTEATGMPARRTRAARIDPEKRRHYVEVAAYYIAERRGFINGDETDDWLAAEQEIDRLLDEEKLSA